MAYAGSVEYATDFASVMIVYTARDGVGVPLTAAPRCNVVSGITHYEDSYGTYDVSCLMRVQYADSKAWQRYDPMKKNIPVVKFAAVTSWDLDGISVDPAHVPFPSTYSYAFDLSVIGTSPQAPTTVMFDSQKSQDGTTYLTLDIDDVVSFTDDVATIKYNWRVTPGLPFVSALNTQMYMEQIDSNLALSYVKADGSGAAVIVPNTKVSLGDTSTGLTSNGQIKLKLDSKSGFGIRSTRLRVTVVWQ
ncbi:hypothetical protein GP664_26120 [Escherichia coli]|uniref:hypothetical protein n=1 Tax=Escherichia coli TaxID=562 RepID=UPI0012FD4AA7|nr:hypothetical protein [Escherichia coli]MVW21898.1 hypothetical protein [Escherichia coli]